MLTLYQYESSPYCWKVRICLTEKKLEYTPVMPVDRENDPKFKSLTPVGKVPVLVLEDGTPIFESTIINEYLQDRYPQPPLLPNDPADRARARMFEDLADQYLAPALRLMFTANYRYDKGKIYRLKVVNKEQEAEGLRISTGYLQFLDSCLEGTEYFVTEFSLADIGLIPPLARTSRLLKVPLKEKYPNIAAWVDRVLSRPSVKTTSPPPYDVLDDPV
ncbi:MAG TPA: glutathione S-transferase family protein [Patescibacteria group bacterium]|jgi:glutathione S-transferase|nr:glutathione S-transferase family protein [Patescibacteria group bacterium]